MYTLKKTPRVLLCAQLLSYPSLRNVGSTHYGPKYERPKLTGTRWA